MRGGIYSPSSIFDMLPPLMMMMMMTPGFSHTHQRSVGRCIYPPSLLCCPRRRPAARLAVATVAEDCSLLLPGLFFRRWKLKGSCR